MRQLAFLLAAAIVAPGLHAAETEHNSRIVAIDTSLPKGQAPQTSPDRVEPFYETIDGTHFIYNCVIAHTFKTQEAAVEICEIEPVTLRIDNWPETEFIHLLDGEVAITESDGGAIRTFKAGDVFVLPQGFKGVWMQKSRIKKMTVRHPIYWKD